MTTSQPQLSSRQLAFLLATLVAIMPLSVDAYLPSVPQIASSLAADIHQIEKSLSSFMFGVAFGQIVGGSLSDIKGRRNIALAGLCIYLAGCLGLVFVQNATQLMILRSVQALGGGMSAVVVGALVRDNYQGREAAQMFALIGIILMLAPLAAPMLGAFLQAAGGWRSIFVFLFLYASGVFALLFRFLPKHKNPEPLHAAQIRQIGSRYGQVLKNKPALGFLFYQAASFSSMMVFLTESPFVYMNLYGLTPRGFAWVFGCNIVTMMLCNRLTAFGLRRNWASADLLRTGIVLQMCANIALAACVFSLGQPPLWLVVPLVMVSVGTQGLIVANTQAMFMSHYQPAVAGSANALLSASQSLIGSLFAYAATALHNGTPMVMAGMMLFSTGCGLFLLAVCSGAEMRKKAA